MRNLYEVLGVQKDADQAAIRKAFRSLARKYHPDVNKEPDSEQRFKEVNAAYEILSDEQKRSWYDEFGEASLQSGFNPDAARQWRNASRAAPRGGFEGFTGGWGGQGGVDVDDLLGNFFGRGGPRAGGTSRRRRRGADLETTVEIDFVEAIKGTDVFLAHRRPSTCGTCQGEGGTGRQTCSRCRGTGQVTQNYMGMQAVVVCNECAGSGFTFSGECPDCAGSGRVMSQANKRVHVPPGVRDGQALRLRGLGGEGVGGGPSGNLLVNVRVRPHPLLKRAGHDLEMEVPITVREGIEGGSITIPTVDGTLKVKVPPGSNNGQRLRLRNHGVPGGPGERGDLYLVLRPVLPTAVSEEQLDHVRELDEAYQEDVRASLRI